MIRLFFEASCEGLHKDAYHDAVVLALEKLSTGLPIPWKDKRTAQKLTSGQLAKIEIKNFFKELLDEEIKYNTLLCGKQKDMERIIASAGAMYFSLNSRDRKSCLETLELVLPYDSFKKGKCLVVVDGKIAKKKNSRWSGTEYLQYLNIDVCPYCNNADLIHDTTLQYDHYLDKNSYPYLRLNLYNLIPSCPTCNQYRKKFIIDNFGDYAYPYRDSMDSETKYGLDIVDLKQMVDGGIPVDKEDLTLDKRYACSPERSLNLLNKMKILSAVKNTREILRKINEVKRDAFYLHQEVQDDYIRLLGKIDKEKIYERIFKFPFDRGQINNRACLKIQLDIASIFAPELEIKEAL